MAIRSYRSKGLKVFAETGSTRKLAVQKADRIRFILDALEAAQHPADLDLPGLRFHSLAPGQKGRFAVTVSGNYRVTFGFDGTHAIDVDLEDYH